ncbi:hypothetical protein P5V15_002491 [Pogonomyrmex californicus]
MNNLKNIEIQNNPGAKFLGVWTISWTKQVDLTRGKVGKTSGLMRYLNNKERKGLEVNTALLLYKSLVRSVVDYGIYVYFPRENMQRLKMERIQYADKDSFGLQE